MTINSSNAPVEGECVGLDVGDARIGVARINTQARIAEPLAIIKNIESEVFTDVLKVINDFQAVAVVVGLPRGLDGQETAQTLKTREFTSKLKRATTVPVYMIDEAGTTKSAEERSMIYPDASIDSLAAMIVLEDFLQVDNKEILRV